MDSAKYKKLSEYAALLTQQAETEERKKEYAIAIEKYLKTVDVLLVMADAAPNHPAWVQCTTKAEQFQRKIRTLIARAALEQDEAKKSENNQMQSQSATV